MVRNKNKARKDFLKSIVRKSEVVDELLTYTQNKFRKPPCSDYSSLLHKKVDLSEWRSSENLRGKVLVNSLRRMLPQLGFPVEREISKTDEYQKAFYQRVDRFKPSSPIGLRLERPEEINFEIYKSFAGEIPILHVTNSQDFESIVQALAFRNEPIPIPMTMGAAFIKGLPVSIPCNGNERRQMRSQLIVLSNKPYSGVGYGDLGLNNEEDWKRISSLIRREHECAHLFTYRTYGVMSNNIYDELIADYIGIVSTKGHFDLQWFHRFIGLEDYPKYRKGARMENYKGQPRLSRSGFQALIHLLYKASLVVDSFDKCLGKAVSEADYVKRALTLCHFDFLELSMLNCPEEMLATYEEIATLMGCQASVDR